jgi:hypothetical protein
MTRLRCWAFVALAACLAGCSKDKLDEIVEQAKQKAGEVSQSVQETAKAAQQSAAQAAQTAQEQAGLAGSVEITLDAPVKTQACYARLVAFRDGRPGMLQLTSHWLTPQEAFPSILIHAQTEAASLSELAGQTLAAQVFVMPQSGGPVWRTAEGETAQLKIVSVDDQSLKAELVGGTLIQVGGEQSATAFGPIVASVL